MAFVNEKLTKEQREIFIKKGIQNPVSHNQEILSPMFWTINRDTEMCLVNAGSFREFYDENYFVFLTPNTVLFFLAKMEIVSETSVIWKLSNLYNDSASEMISKLTSIDKINKYESHIQEAFSVYKVSGRPQNKNNESVVAIFNFERGKNNEFN